MEELKLVLTTLENVCFDKYGEYVRLIPRLNVEVNQTFKAYKTYTLEVYKKKGKNKEVISYETSTSRVTNDTEKDAVVKDLVSKTSFNLVKLMLENGI